MHEQFQIMYNLDYTIVKHSTNMLWQLTVFDLGTLPVKKLEKLLTNKIHTKYNSKIHTT